MGSSSSSMKLFILIIMILSFSVSSSFQSMICYPEINPILRDLHLQCPNNYIPPFSPPIQIDGESLDGILSSCKTNEYTAILFYASWCPFSRNVLPKFDALASMYPQVKHVKVEQSFSRPSLFSRLGIHSVPSVLLANRTARVQYHGPKDLHSLLNFYQITTGVEHAVNFTEDQLYSSSEKSILLWNPTSLKDEPYLVFSLFFLLLKAFLFICPNIVSTMIALWVTYVPRLNLAIFGESRQLLTHAFHLFDIKSAFSKLKLSNSRNFHHGARSARVLASSFASVSLGETSTPRA
uniref:5'-adenylylsulfate reductase-like 5 n=1 Tax=Erigeron canadensis TaxID=72917 RepID=UPI001CB9C3AE|nr:5'-adenylylsulfate reductase-like 5 [Erigeron canadensis]